MELISTILSRSIYLLELDSLNPVGKRSVAEVSTEIMKRYGFAKAPNDLGDSATDKGAAYLSGRLGSIVIDRLAFYHNGFVVDTRQSTHDSETVAQDLLSTAHNLLGSRTVVSRKHCVSQITFTSNMRLSKVNPVLDEIAEAIQQSLSDNLKQRYIVETTGVGVYIDTTQANIHPAKFAIERRADSPFSDNLYFSSAPLHTDIHLNLVEKFEKSLL